MQEGAADVYVATRTIKQQRDYAVHHHARGGYTDHHPRTHMLRILQPAEGFVEDEKRDRNQRGRVNQRGQHSGAMIAVSFGGTGRAGMQIHCHQRQQQGKKI